MIDPTVGLFFIDRVFSGIGIWLILVAIFYTLAGPGSITYLSAGLLSGAAALLEYKIADSLYEMNGEDE